MCAPPLLAFHVVLGERLETSGEPPHDKVIAVVAAAGKTNRRQRDLPAHVVVYYVIALTLYMQVSYREVLRCLLEGVKCYWDRSGK